jgi:hypothetical protein
MMRFKWFASWSGWKYYAKAAIQGQARYMHALLIQRPAGIEIDHINNDGLDNRMCNLRLATPAQNRANSRLRRHNTTGYKGVYRHENTSKWVSKITVNGVTKYLGYFKDIKDAARMYDLAATVVFGEFAETNANLGLLKKKE